MTQTYGKKKKKKKKKEKKKKKKEKKESDRYCVSEYCVSYTVFGPPLIQSRDISKLFQLLPFLSFRLSLKESI